MTIKRVVRKKRPKRALGFLILLVCTVGICSFFYYQKCQLQKQYDELYAEKQQLERLIEAENQRTEEVEEYKSYVTTKKYIEEVAREALGLVYKNEVIFKTSDD
jgi:cell division protein DivIC